MQCLCRDPFADWLYCNDIQIPNVAIGRHPDGRQLHVLQGVLFCISVGRGTGSGPGSLLLEQLPVDYSKKSWRSTTSLRANIRGPDPTGGAGDLFSGSVAVRRRRAQRERDRLLDVDDGQVRLAPWQVLFRRRGAQCSTIKVKLTILFAD